MFIQLDNLLLIIVGVVPIVVTLIYIGYRLGCYLMRKAAPTVAIGEGGQVHIIIANRPGSRNTVANHDTQNQSVTEVELHDAFASEMSNHVNINEEIAEATGPPSYEVAVSEASQGDFPSRTSSLRSLSLQPPPTYDEAISLASTPVNSRPASRLASLDCS